jgi:hypothetical protein
MWNRLSRVNKPYPSGGETQEIVYIQTQCTTYLYGPFHLGIRWDCKGNLPFLQGVKCATRAYSRAVPNVDTHQKYVLSTISSHYNWSTEAGCLFPHRKKHEKVPELDTQSPYVYSWAPMSGILKIRPYDDKVRPLFWKCPPPSPSPPTLCALPTIKYEVNIIISVNIHR